MESSASKLMQSMLSSIVTFMSQAGMNRRNIEDCFNTCLQNLQPEAIADCERSLPSTAIGCDTVAGAVLRAWQRDPKYIDRSANPKPLHLLNGERSLAALVKSLDSRADAEYVVGAMLKTGLIKRKRPGLFLPTRDAATISEMHPLAIDHIAKTVMRLVETAHRNTVSGKSKRTLIERYAHVPDLDQREAKAFAHFSRQQGAACLDAIEDWLESRRRKKMGPQISRSQAVSAGVHIFAYLGENKVKKVSGKHAAQTRKRPIHARAAHV